MDKPKFWIFMAVFQIFFGIVIFTIARQIYLPVSDSNSEAPSVPGQTSMEWLDGNSQANPPPLDPTTSEPGTLDPIEISRLANEYFANKQYPRAAELYERLLVFNPEDVNTLNNLGITLYHAGRSTDAIARLKEGIALDPSHQRAWLTLGFVNSQIGNVQEARAALTKAVQLGVDTDVGQSATRMLNELQ